MPIVSTTQYINSNLGDAAFDREPVQRLGQQEFLRLLTTQLSNQDPLEPMKDTQFISQMAQFTSLEQARNTYLFDLADAMVGRPVVVALKNDDGSVTRVIGTVSGINLEQGTPKVIVDGDAYPVDKVVEIGSSAA
jgi:flagellar basal-body rod modification protein FlgD